MTPEESLKAEIKKILSYTDDINLICTVMEECAKMCEDGWLDDTIESSLACAECIRKAIP